MMLYVGPDLITKTIVLSACVLTIAIKQEKEVRIMLTTKEEFVKAWTRYIDFYEEDYLWYRDMVIGFCSKYTDNTKDFDKMYFKLTENPVWKRMSHLSQS
jgi:hypothetical protein